MKMDIVDFAYQVIEMNDRIRDLERENEHLRWFKEEYHSLLNESEKHHRVMMSNIFQLCITPGVIEACQENKTFGVEE